MIDEVPREWEKAEIAPATVDAHALADALRPPASAAVAALWWFVFFFLVVTCVNPHIATVSVACAYVAVVVWSREARRRAFLRNLAESPCFSHTAALDPPQRWPNVTVFVPARNEENELEEAARSLATLPYPNLDVWFVNDHSTDRTPQLLDAIQREFPNVHIVHDPPIVDGWFGKSNAIWQAFLQWEQAENTAQSETEPDTNAGPQPVSLDQSWLLFTDADVVFEPGILEQAVALAEHEQLDFLTCMPRLITKTWAEQLLLPTGWRGIAQGADQERLNEPDSFPIGIGAFMLVRYASYRAFGGHEALGGAHPEDSLMAAAVKHIGGRVGFAWTPDLMRVRFYNGYREVKKHTLRKTRILFGDHIHLPLTMMALRLSTTLMALPMMTAGIIPQLIAGRFDIWLTLLAVAGFVLYVNEALEYAGVKQIAEFHPLAPWLHPISGVLRVWFALTLFGQIIANKPMEWRGRREFGTTGNAP